MGNIGIEIAAATFPRQLFGHLYMRSFISRSTLSAILYFITGLSAYIAVIPFPSACLYIVIAKNNFLMAITVKQLPVASHNIIAVYTPPFAFKHAL